MIMDKVEVGVIGGGSWGTALVRVLQYNGHLVHWWVRRESQKQHLERHSLNPDYLSAVKIEPDLLKVTTDLACAIKAPGLIFLAVPSAFLNQVFADLPSDALQEKVVISAVKGIEPVTLLPVHHWLQQVYGLLADSTGVIGGPCHSEEVVMQRLSFLTLGVNSIALDSWIGDYLRTPFLHVECSEDVDGIGMAAVLKNVYGILAGISHGLRYGDNFSAVLVSNAIHEMEQILKQVSGNHRNVNASVYAGDLLVTAYSGFSRNWILGSFIGKGYPVKTALLELKMVAEGYYASSALARMNGLTMADYPMLDTAYRILYEQAPVNEAMQKLAYVMH